MKICPKCKMQIPKDAHICPYCTRKIGIGTLEGIIIIIILVFVIIAYMSSLR